jgi:hypothetical protein
VAEFYMNDNLGNRSVMPNMATPVAGSGLKLTNASADTDGTQTVVAGATYVFTSLATGGFYFSITGVVTTAANVEWVCPIYQSIIIKIPEGVTSLHFATTVNSGVGYLRRLSIA